MGAALVVWVGADLRVGDQVEKGKRCQAAACQPTQTTPHHTTLPQARRRLLVEPPNPDAPVWTNMTYETSVYYAAVDRLGQAPVKTADECASQCAANSLCQYWALCPAEVSEGCTLPSQGTAAPTTIAAGTCITTGDAAPNRTALFTVRKGVCGGGEVLRWRLLGTWQSVACRVACCVACHVAYTLCCMPHWANPLPGACLLLAFAGLRGLSHPLRPSHSGPPPIPPRPIASQLFLCAGPRQGCAVCLGHLQPRQPPCPGTVSCRSANHYRRPHSSHRHKRYHPSGKRH